MSALEFSTFLSDISATIAQHVTRDGDASLASPVAGAHDEHLAEAEALVRRLGTAPIATTRTAATTTSNTAASEATPPAPSSPPLSSSFSPPVSSQPSPQSEVDAFLLDHEKIVWHFPDVASRLIEDLR